MTFETGRVDPGDEIVDDDCPATEERRVVLGARIVGADDEPLEVIDMRVEPDRAGPLDHLPRRSRGERSMEQQATEVFVARLRDRPNQGALVGDDRVAHAELAGEAEGARRHAAGDDRHGDPALDRGPDRRLRPITKQEVVANQGSVEVERDEADREGRAHVVRNAAGGHRPAPRVTRRTRGSPARSGSIDAVHPGKISSTAAGAAVPWSAPISSNATPSSARARGSRLRRRRATARPSGPPSSAIDGSNEAATGRPAIASLLTYGRFARTTSIGAAMIGRRRQQVGLDERDDVGDGVADGILAGELERGGRGVRRQERHVRREVDLPPPQLDGERDDDRSAARPHVGDANRSGVAATPRRAEPGHDRISACLDNAFRLRARNERAAVRRERQPEELLDPTDVGHRLTRRPPGEGFLEPPRGLVPDRQLRVSEQDRPFCPDGVSEQDLGVESS